MNADVRAHFERYALASGRHAPPGYRIEVLPHLSRLEPLAPNAQAWVMFARLPGEQADALIAAEVAHFAALSQAFEWKWHGFDAPPDLPERLLRQGFRADDAEALMVLPTNSPGALALASHAAAAPGAGAGSAAPEGAGRGAAATLCQVGRDIDVGAGVRAAVQLQEQVWGRHFDWLEADLRAAFDDPDTVIDLWLARAAGATVGSGWTVGPAGSAFADLHGGALLPDWRGRGLYTALLGARVQAARSRGVQALHVDAAPMSRPILQHKGFIFICETVPYHLATA